MDSKHIIKVLELLDLRGIKKQGEWVVSCCPFALSEHKGGRDSNPSFGVKISAPSRYNCFTCNKSGNMFSLVYELSSFFPERDYKQILKILADYDEEEEKVVDDKLSSIFSQDTAVSELDFEEWLEAFHPVVNHPYLKNRGITQEIADKVGLRFHSTDARVMIPIRTFAGILIGAQGRDVTNQYKLDKTRPKYKCMRPFKASFDSSVWLGEQFINFDQPIILTEGPFDYLKLIHCYENVLCSMGGATLLNNKLPRIKSASYIITAYDNDDAGEMARKKIGLYFKNLSVKVKHLRLRDTKDIAEMSIRDIKITLKKIRLVNKSLAGGLKWLTG